MLSWASVIGYSVLENGAKGAISSSKGDRYSSIALIVRHRADAYGVLLAIALPTNNTA
ncbi:hypothetical protein H6H01_35630 [Nostoc calcicola FACHB-3891]|nr:hypothetical protein [Nostoc calcicola FACHB-3891]